MKTKQNKEIKKEGNIEKRKRERECVCVFVREGVKKTMTVSQVWNLS